MKLKGKNLGERQQDFNTKVNDAVSKKINFSAIRDDPVDTDIDQLFKIDIASRLKDVAFLLKTLTSGDSLYITRALKSDCLFDDEYQNVMNPDYLSENIFPQMSSKMMKKLLTTAAIQIKNEERAEKFYLYCKENGMANIASKFIVATSDVFKANVLLNDFEFVKDLEEDMIQFLIGGSYKLAELYLSKAGRGVLHQLRFLYSVDCDKYLDILETNYNPDTYSRDRYDLRISRGDRYGLRISKDIFKRHKERILKHPRIYMKLLNQSTIVKYSNIEDAKFFLTALLPEEPDKFWYCYMNEFEFIIKIIPHGQRYEFLKNMHDEKYGIALEVNRIFYENKYYVHMTEAQQEKWALEQLASKKEILGSGQDFLWYKFIKFDMAFEEIKKLISITQDGDKRIQMLWLLIERATNQTELETLLSYFYKRHGNEMEKSKIKFLGRVIAYHNVFSFDRNCWNAFNKILYGLDIYNAQNLCCNMKYRLIALLYPILHGMELPEVLRCWVIEFNVNNYINCSMKTKIMQFDQNGLETIYKYILQVYLDEMYRLDKQENEEEASTKAVSLITDIFRLRRKFHKSDDLPEIVTKFIIKFYPEANPEPKKTEMIDPVTPQEFLRMLKKDASLVTNFDLLERNIQYALKYNIKELLQKLRIYFHDDIAQQYFEYFRKAYTKEDCKIIYASVFGILLLADEKFKSEFILQHSPEDAKVQFDEIDRNELYIREAICRFACYSRPPIEIDNISKYIKGDYLQYCFPMFNVYVTRYPPVIRMKFVKSLLNTPVSIQKHGIRLAYICFKTEEFIDLILKSWKKYQNVSLRMVIYHCVFTSVKKCKATRHEMFEVLKKITLDLKEDECDEVRKISMDIAYFPGELRGIYLVTLWTAISKFSDCKLNIAAKANIIKAMAEYVDYIPRDTIKKIVTSHVDEMLVKNKIIPDKERSSNLIIYDEDMWALTHTYICKYCKDEDILELVKFIIQRCVERWNDAHFDDRRKKHIYVFNNFCSVFIKSLIDKSYRSKSAVEFNRVLESVMAHLIDSIPKREIFTLVLNLKIVILTNRVLEYAGITFKNCKNHEKDFEYYNNIAKECVKELENFLREIILKKSYNTAFTNFISDVIESSVSKMASYLSCSYKMLIISIASNLADSSMVEILLLAVALTYLSYDKIQEWIDCGQEWNDWNDNENDENDKFNVLKNKLADIDIDEVQYFIKIMSSSRRKNSWSCF